MPGNLGAISETLIIPPGCRESFFMFMDGRFGPIRGGGGYSQLCEAYAITRKGPFTHLVMYTMEGSGRVSYEGGDLLLHKGDVWVSPAGFDQHYMADGDWECFWFHLVEDERWEHLSAGGPRVFEAHDISAMGQAVRSYVKEIEIEQMSSEELTDLYARAIRIYLERDLNPQGMSNEMATRSMLGKLWDRVTNDISDGWTVAAMSSIIHVSPATLHRAVLTHYGNTPMQMVGKFRMRRAEQLLISTRYTLEQIAGMVGYATPFAFSRAFKRFSGYSPQIFRGMHQMGQYRDI